MQITIETSSHKLVLCLGRRDIPLRSGVREVVTEREASSLLEACAAEAFSMRRLRLLLREIEPGMDDQLSDRRVLQHVARWFAGRRMRLWIELPPVCATSLHAVPNEEEIEPLQLEVEPELSRVAFQVLERGTGTPIPGITLSVTLPDGSVTEQSTDDDGLVDLQDVPEGACSVRSERNGRHRGQSVVFTGFGYFVPSTARRASGWIRSVLDGLHPAGELPVEDEPAALVRVVEHRVATGQTLESIAEQHGVTVDDITEFNWGTTDPTAVGAALATEVGCHRRNPDTGSLEMSDDDDPGIIRVPLPFECDGRLTDTRHILQVERPRPRPRWVFSL